MEENIDYKQKKEEIEQRAINYKTVHKKTFTLIVPKTEDEEGDFYYAILRGLTRNEMSALFQLAKVADPIKQLEYIFKTCWLCGDNEIQTDDDIFFGQLGIVTDMIEFKQGYLKKN